MPPQNCNLSVHKMMCLCVSIWMLFKLILLFALSINEHVIRNQSDAKTLQQLQSWTQHENSKQNIRTHTQKKPNDIQQPQKLECMYTVALSCAACNFMCLASRVNVKEHETKGISMSTKKASSSGSCSKKRRKKQSFQWHRQVHNAVETFYFVHEKKKLFARFIYTDRQAVGRCTDGGSRLLKHTRRANQATRTNEKWQEKKSSTRRQAHMWYHNRSARKTRTEKKHFTNATRKKRSENPCSHIWPSTSGMVFSRSLCVQETGCEKVECTYRKKEPALMEWVWEMHRGYGNKASKNVAVCSSDSFQWDIIQ